MVHSDTVIYSNGNNNCDQANHFVNNTDQDLDSLNNDDPIQLMNKFESLLGEENDEMLILLEIN